MQVSVHFIRDGLRCNSSSSGSSNTSNSTMWQVGAAVDSQQPFDPEALKAKGDEIQKLSVIETLPQLLAEDAHSCITRVLPKIQQSLPTASTEFHMAASVIFKQVLEQRLVSVFTFTEVFLQSILSSLESREPVISHAWLETILDVIELLPVDIVKREILPIAVNAGQLSQTVNSRIMCCRLLGKIATRFDPASVKKDVLPTVQSLCMDLNLDVRACICLQLRHIAENIGEDILKVLPMLVELTNDEASTVRQAAVQTIGHLLPQLQPDTIKDIIVPLIKLTCENALKAEDTVICVVAQEFGKLAQSSKSHLTPTDKTWFIKFYIQLAQLDTSTTKVEEKKDDFTFVGRGNIQLNDRSIECRKNCAFNIPAMFLFAASASEGVSAIIPTFRNLATDSYYVVRRTIACSLHEIVRVLGTKSGLIKSEIIRLLQDDNEEVLQGLIPHISEVLELLLVNQIIGVDQTESSTLDLGRALIKCEAEVSSTNNWRLSALMLNQLEVVPKCFSSDFIYTYLVPVARKRILFSRPLPVRLAAGRTCLIFLRYNLKPQQRLDIRNQVCTDFAHNSSCYVRMIFIRMMMEAMTIFSSVYFKEHFCSALLSLMEDPVANIRLKVVSLAPTIRSILRLPADKKLLSILETNLRNLMSNEKDKDVSAALTEATRLMENLEVRVDSQPSPTKLSRYDSEDMKKYEEEKKIEAMLSGKTGKSTNGSKLLHQTTPNVSKIQPQIRPTSFETPIRPIRGKPTSASSPKSSVPPKPTLIKQNSLTARQMPDLPKASTSNDNLTSSWPRFTSSTQPWERAATSSCHNSTLTSTNPSYSSAAVDYTTRKVQCSCYELADRLFRTQPFSSNFPEQAYHSNSTNCSCLNDTNYLKTTNLFHTKHDYRFSDLAKPLLTTGLPTGEKHDFWEDLLLTRSDFSSKYRTPEFARLQSPYNPYWTFSSMPEIPVTLIDDEFMVDAGIRIPSQIASSQSTSKIPNLQDIIYRNKKLTNSDRLRRYGSSFEKSKQFAYGMQKSYSVDYDDNGKPITSIPNNRESYASPTDDRPKSSGSSSQNRTRYSYETNQRKSDDDKVKRTFAEKEHIKPLQPRNIIQDRNKRHSSSYSGVTKPLPETKESKLTKFKRHSVEVPDYNPDRNAPSRALRRLATLDVNHNQGLSKIPVRSVHTSGSRTAPVTRTSSPIRIDSELFKKIGGYENGGEGFSQDRRVRRFRSSDEEVDKLCQKF